MSKYLPVYKVSLLEDATYSKTSTHESNGQCFCKFRQKMLTKKIYVGKMRNIGVIDFIPRALRDTNIGTM